ncbi:MAG: winged helix-turn-helix transcriptional regulator [Acidimicrobiia bacterium]
MRSYHQYCAFARALDIIGDRWTLLIIRELLLRDSRYSDLQDALPGIATNLLADRLRMLQSAGLVEPYEAPPPVRATVYRLTPRGIDLRPAVRAMVAWGLPLLASGQEDDVFRTQWLVAELRVMFEGVEASDLEPLDVVIETGSEPASISIGESGLTVSLGASSREPLVRIQGGPERVFALLSGAEPSPEGVSVEGSHDSLRRLRTLIKRASAKAQSTAAR